MVFGPLSFGRLSLLIEVPISVNSSQPVSLRQPSPSAVSESVDVDERRAVTSALRLLRLLLVASNFTLTDHACL